MGEEKTKEQIERERAIQMTYVDRLFDEHEPHGSADFAVRDYILELRARIAELEGGQPRPRAKRGEVKTEPE